jgi:hypothetical protein
MRQLPGRKRRRSGPARAAFVRGQYTEAARALDAASDLYCRAEQTAREADRPEPDVAERVREPHARERQSSKPSTSATGEGPTPSSALDKAQA